MEPTQSFTLSFYLDLTVDPSLRTTTQSSWLWKLKTNEMYRPRDPPNSDSVNEGFHLVVVVGKPCTKVVVPILWTHSDVRVLPDHDLDGDLNYKKRDLCRVRSRFTEGS